jgi:uncharacterized membrane protein (UPF0127 family)
MNNATITFHTNKKPFPTLLCTIADTYKKKTLGLMHTKSLPQNHGMLFTFNYTLPRLFWMKNMTIPLDIIFINKKFIITKIKQINPHTTPLHHDYYALASAKYIIETHQHYCKNHTITTNTTLTIKQQTI